MRSIHIRGFTRTPNRSWMTLRFGWSVLAGTCWLTSVLAIEGEVPAAPVEADEASSSATKNAYRLFKSGEKLLENKEYDRGVGVLEKVIAQYPKTIHSLKAHLLIGKHLISQGKHPEGVEHLRPLIALKNQKLREEKKLEGDELELYLEGMYQAGLSAYETGQYPAAFRYFRGITDDYKETVWGNQSYYYIGMCHFHLGNWSNAVEALALVGTFVDPNSPVAQYVEAGRRFFAKVEDADFPVLTRQGFKITAQIKTKSGDQETVEFSKLTRKGDVMIASIGSDIGVAKPGDNVLQVIGGDEISLTYLDENDHAGEKGVPRVCKVQVVSTGSVAFTRGTYEGTPDAAYQNAPFFMKLIDADKDVGPQKDKVQLKLVSRYQAPVEDKDVEVQAADEASKKGVEKWDTDEFEEKIKYIIRDEVDVTLDEVGDNTPVHTGQFIGSIQVVSATEGKDPDRTDGLLGAVIGDEIVATYVDTLHGNGKDPRTATAQINVVGPLQNDPKTTVAYVPDPVIRAQKSLKEASAFLAIGEIFASMGLYDGASRKCDEGLALVNPVINSKDALPSELKETAFKFRWELFLIKKDFAAAIETCMLFSKLYPDSPFADQALMGIGKIRMQEGETDEAIQIFGKVLQLQNSENKAEAMFLIAGAVEKKAEIQAAESRFKGSQTQGDPRKISMPYYKRCADQYPRSLFAAPSLTKVVEYYEEAKEYAQANELLEHIFEDYPDVDFLDEMLFKWVRVAVRMNDYGKAVAKCQKLLFDYPSSKYADAAKKLLPKLQEKLEKPSSAATPKKSDAESADQ